jgi:PAS domain S-box-containing protein
MNELLTKQSELALQFDLAIREYAKETIRPFAEQHVSQEEFIPETMSTSFVARSIFEKVHKKFPDYIIKFSSDNPRNPNNQAGPEELEMIEYFNDNPKARNWAGQINLNGKPHLVQFYARRMKESCLRCHGDPGDAPPALLELYGNKAGFHRPVGDVIALDTVAIPVDKYRSAAFANTVKHSAVVLVALAFLLVAVYYTFQILVTRRLMRISRHFSNAIGNAEKSTISPINYQADDEIGDLVSAFNDMAIDLHKTTTSVENLNKEIADRKRAEERVRKERDFAEALVETAQTIVLVLDMKGHIVRFNPYMEEISGYRLKEVKGKDWFSTFLPKGDWERIRKLFLQAKEDIQTRGNVNIIVTKDGRELEIEWYDKTIKDGEGNTIAILAIGHDITERKKAERKQNELIKKVDNINKELKEFASIVSHDLKSPLRGIKTLASWILADCADKLGEEAIEQMNLLLGRVELMHDLIEGILQYSRAGQAEGKRIQVNLNDFVPEIINMVVPPENITVTIENELPVIECEEIHIMQIFQNLLSNAIKYMDKPKGRIQVACVEQDGFWKFSVADNGPGIEEKHFEKIFKIFQALPTSPDFEGTGVGLTVTKKLVELYNGKVWVESKVSEGSTFFFTFPKQEIKASNEKVEAHIAC